MLLEAVKMQGAGFESKNVFCIFLLIISTPDAHEERRKKEVMQLD